MSGMCDIIFPSKLVIENVKEKRFGKIQCFLILAPVDFELPASQFVENKGFSPILPRQG